MNEKLTNETNALTGTMQTLGFRIKHLMADTKRDCAQLQRRAARLLNADGLLDAYEAAFLPQDITKINETMAETKAAVEALRTLRWIGKEMHGIDAPAFERITGLNSETFAPITAQGGAS